MDHKELGKNSSVSTSVGDGSTKFALNSPTVLSSRNKIYDVGSSSVGKVEATSARPCAIIGPDRVVPPNPDDSMYLKKMPGEAWPPSENVYRRPPDYPCKISDYQPTRNISPRQTFQENMQRIMVPPTFSSMKTSEVSNLKSPKLNMPQEVKYCDVPYNVNSVNNEHKSVRNSDIPMSNVNSYPRNLPPPYGWPTGVNARPLRPYGAPEFYQYQEFPSCAGPRPMTMIRPHRPLHEESVPVYSERLYQDANIRFKPYPSGKEKHQSRYDYVSNYPNTFHPPASLPPNKYELQKSIHGHPYPVYPPGPYKYLDRRLHEPVVDGYHRSHSQQANLNTFNSQIVHPPYGPLPGNCMQNKTYSDVSSKPVSVNKLQFENNNKVYFNLDSRNKNYSVPENLYYNELNHFQAMRGEILLPTHSTLNIPPIQHSIYRKDNTPLKPYDYNPNYRIFDQSINVNHSLQRLPVQFSPNTVAISPDSNTSNDTIHTIGPPQEDCGYVSQSSTTSIRSFDSGNMSSPHDIYRRHCYNNYDMVRNMYHPIGPGQISKNKNNSSNKKNINVRQFLQMWNEGDEEVSEANKEAAAQNNAKIITSQSETINNQEQLYVLGLVNVPNEELGKYDHIQKISKLPENIKGYNSIEILNKYEELLETPHVSNYNRSREFKALSKNQIDKDITTKMPRPISPLDVEAKISQSVIHKEVGCNFEIKPCSPDMLNVEVAAPVQNILSERIIEKVANPIISKSPNLNRCENNKAQNIVKDTVNSASCKMINDQYSSNNSPSRIKTTNYSVQDLELNAGLCLASLPQLDNDIELNFPEINQQFIKANQMVSNDASDLQNLQHMDLEHTLLCLPAETRHDSRQENLPQVPLDKEFSKLSKFRKGRKFEFTSSCNLTKQDVQSGESVAALQRIDSVIIKNTNKTQDESVKITSEINYSFHKEAEPTHSYKYIKNIETHDLTSETAIDFSLNRSEEETAVRYLNEIDRNVNQNLPPLDEFDEEGLNENENISITSGSVEVQHMSEKLNNMQTAELAEDLQTEPPIFKISKIDANQYNNLIKVPVKSPINDIANEENDVLVMRNEATAEPKLLTVKNLTSTEKTTNIETCGLQIHSNNSENQELKEVKIFTDFKPKPNDQSKKEIDVFSPIKPFKDIGLKNEVVSNRVSESSFGTKAFVDNVDITEDQSIEEVLKDLSYQAIENIDTKISSYDTVKNDDCKDLPATKSEGEIIELESNTLVNKTIKENIGIVLDKSDVKILRTEGNCNNTDQSVTIEPNVNECIKDVRHHKASAVEDLKLKKTSNMMLSYTEETYCGETETDVPDLKIEIADNNPSTVSRSLEKQENKIKRFEFLSDKNVNNNLNYNKILSMSTESFLKETNNKSKCVSENMQDVSDDDNMSKKADLNSNDKKEPCIPKNETVSHTSLEIEEFPKSQESLLSAMEEKQIDKAESEYLYYEDAYGNDNTVEESCLHKTVPINQFSKITQDMNKNRHLNTNQGENIDIDEFGHLSDKSCIPAYNVEKSCLFIQTKKTPEKAAATFIECTEATNTNRHPQTNDKIPIYLKESCLSTQNITYPENLPIIAVESRHDTEMDDNLQNNNGDAVESELVCRESYINSMQPAEDSHLTLNIKNQAVMNLECKRGLKKGNSINKDFKTNVHTVETEYLSNMDSRNNVTECGLSKSHKISQEKLILESAESTTEVKVFLSVAKLNAIVPETIDRSHKFNDANKMLNIENTRLQPWKFKSVDSDVADLRHPNCGKELHSPWIQKLLMFTEGTCKLSGNKNSVKQENKLVKNTDEIEDPCFVNVELMSSENNNMEALNSYNKVYNEFRDVVNEVHLLKDNYVKKQIVSVEDSDSLSEKYQGIKIEDIKSLPVIKPQKILKRSYSESALEAYKDYDDINFLQLRKRRKSIKEPRERDQSFLESRLITEDLCNIIHSNRRNSISTFYNEDNVYIVIENDLILTEENDDPDKLCYTENTEEFLTGTESTTCGIYPNSCVDEPNQVCEYSDSLQHIEDKTIEGSWVDDVACIETIFSEDVAENITIDVHASPKNIDQESTLFHDSDHIDKLKSIYGRTICNDNTQLIETLYKTPQMNVNRTLYHIESQDPEECLDDLMTLNGSCLESNENIDCTEILESGFSSHVGVADSKENMPEKLSGQSKLCNHNIYPTFNHENDFKFEDFSTEEQIHKFTFHSCESSNDCLTSNIPKENSSYSCSSSPEVSSTTSEEKSSSILLKITNCNGSRVSKINEINIDSSNKLSYKLTEKIEYKNYSSNFSSSKTLITKAAQKYIPPLKETIYDLKVKLPLPQHRLNTLKQLKIAKVEPKGDATASICCAKRSNHDISKKQKPKFEDVLKSIDEINFKKHRDNLKKGKIAIPKVIIKKNENGAHYASSKTVNRKESYNPDLTGRKWQPWVFLEKNKFIDSMALQNKAKAVFCHKKNSYVLLEKFRKYKSVYNANFVISQPKSETKGNLKYTIRLKHN